MSLRIARGGRGRSAILFLGAVVLAAVLWPLLGRMMDRFTSGLDHPASAVKK
jgi:hypothetical protein